MKKLTLMFAMLSIAALTIFTSCNKEDAEDAKISLVLRRVSTNGDTTVNFNSGGSAFTGNRIIVEARFEGNSDNKLKSYNMVGAWTGATAKTGSLSGTSTSIFDTILVSQDPGTYSYVATLTSDKGNVTQSFNFVVPTSGGGGGTDPQYSINSSNLFLGNQTASEGSFWSSERDSIYTTTMLNATNIGDIRKGLVDIVYFSAGTVNRLGSTRASEASTAFPNTLATTNWSQNLRRDTRLILTSAITATEFSLANDSASIDNLIKKAIDAAPSDIPNQSVAATSNQIFLVRFSNGRYGLISVATASGSGTGVGATAGNLSAIVKYQRPL
jgi:hypothetical protein